MDYLKIIAVEGDQARMTGTNNLNSCQYDGCFNMQIQRNIGLSRALSFQSSQKAILRNKLKIKILSFFSINIKLFLKYCFPVISYLLFCSTQSSVCLSVCLSKQITIAKQTKIHKFLLYVFYFTIFFFLLKPKSSLNLNVSYNIRIYNYIEKIHPYIISRYIFTYIHKFV